MKVLLVVIDGASPRVFCPAVQTGRLPSLLRIASCGQMHQASTTIFPSITPAATTSILTGCYPSEHGIAGAAWYDDVRKEIAYYGDDFWVAAKEGFGAFLRDFLVRLNGDRLKAPTLFELVERTGRRAGSINYLVYRGLTSHDVNVPWLLTLLPGVPFTESVEGPSLLCLGDFVARDVGRRRTVDGRGGLLHRFGMDDASTAAILCELAAQGPLPDFTVAYFADNDYRSHDVGPVAALPTLERVDAALGAMFDAAGGFERFMRDTAVVVTSDHGHCEILPDASRAVVRLDALLEGFRIGRLGRPWRPDDDLLICPNMRAAQIYFREPSPPLVARVTRALLADPRVELVISRADAGQSEYLVESRGGTLSFRRSAASGTWRDAFGGGWEWKGDSAALRLHASDGRIESEEYPNPFERIVGVMDAPTSGDLWVTARPGCEFEWEGSPPHVGGSSHGGLHALDSLSPVILGGPGVPALPRAMRSVDIAPLCMQLLGLPMRYAVGDPRGAAAAAVARAAR